MSMSVKVVLTKDGKETTYDFPVVEDVVDWGVSPYSSGVTCRYGFEFNAALDDEGHTLYVTERPV